MTEDRRQMTEGFDFGIRMGNVKHGVEYYWTANQWSWRPI